MGVKEIVDNLSDVVVSAGTLILVVVLIIVLLAKVKTTSTISAINEAGINTSINTGITAIQTPIDWIELIVVFFVLIMVITLFIKALRGKGGDGKMNF